MIYRPGVAKGKGKERKGPLGKHPISQAPKLDADLQKTDEASDASDADSIGANSSQEAPDDSSHAAVKAAAHQGMAPPWQLWGWACGTGVPHVVPNCWGGWGRDGWGRGLTC